MPIAPAFADRRFYIASPYSNSSPLIQEIRFNQVCRHTAKLIAEGYLCYSPIAHSHPIAKAGDLSGDWEFWARQCTTWIKTCSDFVIIELEGWSLSAGIAYERRLATLHGLKLHSLNPNLTTSIPDQLAASLIDRPAYA